ncbi:hypothetical protein AAFO92_16005 [Roseovarius sp. CAU 1744]|uniref:hypothetical protein n=1 Tax=Roseovarius sp. CAU 1744 TaxID=3140368 RepID=UPI00325BD969
MAKKRVVKTAPGFEEDVLSSMQSLSLDAKQNTVVAYETLWRTDPPLQNRRGLLGSRYEVFALEIEKSPDIRFVVSIDHSDRETILTILHGVLPALNINSAAGTLVARHLKATHLAWET